MYVKHRGTLDFTLHLTFVRFICLATTAILNRFLQPDLSSPSNPATTVSTSYPVDSPDREILAIYMYAQPTCNLITTIGSLDNMRTKQSITISVTFFIGKAAIFVRMLQMK